MPRTTERTANKERQRAVGTRGGYEVTSAGRVSVKVNTLLGSPAVQDVARLAKRLVELQEEERLRTPGTLK